MYQGYKTEMVDDKKLKKLNFETNSFLPFLPLLGKNAIYILRQNLFSKHNRKSITLFNVNVVVKGSTPLLWLFLDGNPARTWQQEARCSQEK